MESAGRANPTVTATLRTVNRISQAVVVIGIGVSLYSVTTAEEWEVQLGRQVLSWSGAIVGGQLGVGVGVIYGPAGAILGGLVGIYLGGLGATALGNWFIGGSSSSRAVDLPGLVLLQPASEQVGKRMKESNVAWYTHHIRAVHVSVGFADDASETVDRIVEDILNNIPSEKSHSPSTSADGSDQSEVRRPLF